MAEIYWKSQFFVGPTSVCQEELLESVLLALLLLEMLFMVSFISVFLSNNIRYSYNYLLHVTWSDSNCRRNIPWSLLSWNSNKWAWETEPSIRHAFPVISPRIVLNQVRSRLLFLKGCFSYLSLFLMQTNVSHLWILEFLFPLDTLLFHWEHPRKYQARSPPSQKQVAMLAADCIKEWDTS